MKTVFALLIMLGISACSISSLQLTKAKDILLSHANATAVIHATGVERGFVNASPVYVYRDILRTDEGNLLVCERTLIDDFYVYTYDTARTISLLFDAKEVRPLLVGNNLHFFQLTLQNRAVINIVVHQSGDQSLSFVYGFSDKQLRTLIRQLKQPGDLLKASPEKSTLLPNNAQTAIKSRWSDEVLFFGPLVSPAHQRMH